MSKTKRKNAYSKRPEAAWEATRNYYEYNGVRDTQIGWSKRLGMTPNSFLNRLKLYRDGKIDKDLLFRPVGHGKQVHTKYEAKLPPEKLLAIKRQNIAKARAACDPVPPCHTVRVWETVFAALKELKPPMQSWSRFFIERFKLKVPIPRGSR